MTPYRQPWLHDLIVALQAPTAALGAADWQMRPGGVHGVLHADIRVLNQARLTVDGEEPTPLAGGLCGASGARFTALARSLGDPGADPTVRVERERRVTPGVVEERIRIVSYAHVEVVAEAVLELAADLSPIERVKTGRPAVSVQVREEPADASGAPGLAWDGDGATVRVTAEGAGVTATAGADGSAALRWPVRLAPGAQCVLAWRLTAEVQGAPVVAAAVGSAADGIWDGARVRGGDTRLSALADRSFADLRALLMVPAAAPRDLFAAAGAPWFFTLFGRDSIWAARLMLPFGWELAAGTLRTLASYQGTQVDADSMQAPGKIPHELRRAETAHPGTGGAPAMSLPPLYYGTVDATPLWVCLLHDAWRAGMPDDQVRALIPNLQAALTWVTEYGDEDGDGFLEYLDTTGRGLANQGWKDSGDSVRYRDGSLAEGPVALCEVQGYAYEAAVSGASLLDAFGVEGGDRLREWAEALAVRFRAQFWVEDAEGGYPALALDGAKRPVDSLTSNIGHLLGTGILDERESGLVVDRLVGPAMNNGFGLRTMSGTDGGYSPLSYHCGSVWPHDTAIVVRGMAAAGHAADARGLIDGLLAAAEQFDGRLPELFAGDASTEVSRPMPYPAACRPQAWAAASIGAIVQCLLGLNVDVPGGSVSVDPLSEHRFGAVEIKGLMAGTERFDIELSASGHTTASGPGSAALRISPAR